MISLTRKQTAIFAIFILIIAVGALLLLFNPFSADPSAPAASVADAEPSSVKSGNEIDASDAVSEQTADNESSSSVRIRQINVGLTEGRMHLFDAIRTYAEKNWNFPYEI